MRTTLVIIQTIFLVLQCMMGSIGLKTNKNIYSTLSYICCGIVLGLMIASIVSGFYD